MRPGDVISDRYRLLRLIDVGGMGEVWAARNELTQKCFAIKFLLPALAERPDALARFVREAETAGKLDHPSIVDVFDVAQAEDGRPFIVMELLAGESLEARIERTGPLTSLDAASLLAQIAAALAVAHAAGVVHRDLSTANVFLARDPEGGRPVPKILDFGVSKSIGAAVLEGNRTAHGAVLGCPEYMSPEQAQGAEGVDARTDIWSVGAVLYHALSGVTPFRSHNYNALISALLTRPHRRLSEVVPSVDPELAGLVEACLVKDRARRIQTAADLASRLSAVARRLAAASGETATQRRRVTDRLPQRGLDGGDAPRSGDARARTAVLAVTSAAVGLLLGVLLTLAVSGPPSAVVVQGPEASVPAPVR